MWIQSPQVYLDEGNKYIICFGFDQSVVEEIISPSHIFYTIEPHSDLQIRFAFTDETAFRACAIALKLHFGQFNDR